MRQEKKQYLYYMNAGKRLSEVIAHLNAGNQTEFAGLVEKSQPTLSRWLGMSNFSPEILRSLSVLKKHGINISCFENDKEPMLSVEIFTEEDLRAELKNLKRQISEMRERENWVPGRLAKVLEIVERIEGNIQK